VGVICPNFNLYVLRCEICNNQKIEAWAKCRPYQTLNTTAGEHHVGPMYPTNGNEFEKQYNISQSAEQVSNRFDTEVNIQIETMCCNRSRNILSLGVFLDVALCALIIDSPA